MITDLYVEGMHGLGDNLHQRAVVRQLIAAGRRVWLNTPWPCIYHDLVGEQLRLVGGSSFLRTQAKNARRERTAFACATPPREARQRPPLRVAYPPDAVRAEGSVLKAMLATCRLDTAQTDFRLPVPAAWLTEADAWLAKWSPDRPVMIYRPLVERREWGGNAPRNPDPEAYADLVEAIRERFFVVSVADLQPHAEWQVGFDIGADVEVHRGELSFEAMAGLMVRAGLVFTAPGFALVLAQAVGAAHVAVFGGYERAYSFSAGAPYAPHLSIEPERGCDCFSHRHACDKRIDIEAAKARLLAFVDGLDLEDCDARRVA